MSTSTYVCAQCESPLSLSAPPFEQRAFCHSCQRMVTVRESKASTANSTVDFAAQSQQCETVDQVHGSSAAASSSPAELPEFDILEVLGRGGMGVVYKARQRKLERLVALKMILAGEHAGPQQVERFLNEARAAAKLQHPHIVQIFEVGEHRQLPYLALELVAGGTLEQRWRKQPQPPYQAAMMVETLARAMHVAHEQGIIHRDLKPANVLLTADGAPKIADFGLAKHVEDAHGLTGSDAVLGTPSFMAPEQALGHSREVGPATDVYALGAILYTGLTGKPPFRGASKMDVIRQVVERNPVPPSQVKRGLPRDLETICLKCLDKEPGARYATAAALADDLKRFLQGEPIQARPARLWERCWKWVRRHPIPTALVAMTLLAVLLGVSILWTRHDRDLATEQQRRYTELAAEIDNSMAAAKLENAVQPYLALEAKVLQETGLTADAHTALRSMLNKGFAAIGQQVLREKTVLSRHERSLLEGHVALLAERDAVLAQAVRDLLLRRQREVEVVLHLQPPFSEAGKFFTQAHEVRAGKLHFADTAAKPGRRVLAEVPCTRHAELELVAQHATWDISEPLALLLNTGPATEYAFQLETVEEKLADEERPEQPTAIAFAAAWQRDGLARMRIVKGRHELAKKHVPVRQLWPQPPVNARLLLKAARAGDALTFHCNGVTLAFEDNMPLNAKQAGVFGLALPSSVGILSLGAMIERAAEQQSPLERGDDLYALGQWSAAALEYQLQAQAPTTEPRFRQEALYKAALCYVEEKSEDKAGRLLESVATDTAVERLRVLALAQLWALRVRQRRDAEAAELFRSLHRGRRIAELSLFMPERLRAETLTTIRFRLQTSLAQLLQRPGQLEQMEHLVEIEEFFGTPLAARNYTRACVVRALARAGQTAKATSLARALLKDAPSPDKSSQSWWFLVWEDYVLTLRQQGQAAVALAEIDARLFSKPGTYRQECLPLLVERAGVLDALGRPAEAEQDLAAFLSRATPTVPLCGAWTRACLMLGLLRRERGDEAGAQAAWQRGLPGSAPGLGWLLDRSSPLTPPQQAMLCVLCERYTEEECGRMLEQLIRQMGGVVHAQGIPQFMEQALPFNGPKVLAPIIRMVFQRPEGKQIMRAVAFREQSTTELLRGVMVQGFQQMTRNEIKPHQLTEDEENVMRALGEEGYAQFTLGKMNYKQIFAASQLANLFYNKLALPFDIAASSFEPPLRGPIAYYIGLRHLHVQRNPKSAERYFQSALKSAPAGSTLHQLATAQLAELKAVPR